jgi:ATP-dependent 26S proteasome regulatory subunit
LSSVLLLQIYKILFAAEIENGTSTKKNINKKTKKQKKKGENPKQNNKKKNTRSTSKNKNIEKTDKTKKSQRVTSPSNILNNVIPEISKKTSSDLIVKSKKKKPFFKTFLTDIITSLIKDELEKNKENV